MDMGNELLPKNIEFKEEEEKENIKGKKETLDLSANKDRRDQNPLQRPDHICWEGNGRSMHASIPTYPPSLGRQGMYRYEFSRPVVLYLTLVYFALWVEMALHWPRISVWMNPSRGSIE